MKRKADLTDKGSGVRASQDETRFTSIFYSTKIWVEDDYVVVSEGQLIYFIEKCLSLL